MEPENEYTPGRGKSSSKPSFSGSMLIFVGVNSKSPCAEYCQIVVFLILFSMSKSTIWLVIWKVKVEHITYIVF